MVWFGHSNWLLCVQNSLWAEHVTYSSKLIKLDELVINDRNEKGSILFKPDWVPLPQNDFWQIFIFVEQQRTVVVNIFKTLLSFCLKCLQYVFLKPSLILWKMAYSFLSKSFWKSQLYFCSEIQNAVLISMQLIRTPDKNIVTLITISSAYIQVVLSGP